jgi:hypothetical protein
MITVDTIFNQPLQLRANVLLKNEILFKCKEKENLVTLAETTTKTSTLLELSHHEFWIIRKRVAENIHTPLKALQTLVYDPDYLVRLALAGNPNIDHESLEVLSKDTNFFVSQSAKRKLK